MAVVTQGEGTSYPSLGFNTDQVNQLDEAATFTQIPANANQVLQQPEVVGFTSIPFDSNDVVQVNESRRYIITSLTQSVSQTTVNKVWDTVAGAWVRWESEEIDHGGAYYPGPGDFETQTSDFRIETIKFTRV